MDLLTCIEVAKKYRVGKHTVWSWIRTGKLPAIKLVKGYRITPEALAAFEKEMSKSV